MRTTLLNQIAQRRKNLGVRTSDMPALAGLNRQQYEKIEKGGNPSLQTLDKIAEGLDAELFLVPKEKLQMIKNLLAESYFKDVSYQVKSAGSPINDDQVNEGVVDPWALIEKKDYSA